MIPGATPLGQQATRQSPVRLGAEPKPILRFKYVNITLPFGTDGLNSLYYTVYVPALFRVRPCDAGRFGAEAGKTDASLCLALRGASGFVLLRSRVSQHRNGWTKEIHSKLKPEQDVHSLCFGPYGIHMVYIIYHDIHDIHDIQNIHTIHIAYMMCIAIHSLHNIYIYMIHMI